MTYAKPRIPIPFMATLVNHNINDRNTKSQALNTSAFLKAAYIDNGIPFKNGKHNFKSIPENTIKLAHYCNAENFKTEMASVRNYKTVQKEFILPESQIVFQKALE